MDSFTTKLPIYDTLAMIVPGCVVCGIPMHFWDVYVGQSVSVEWVKSNWVYFIIIAYIVGLFISAIAEKLFSRFRNRLSDVEDARQRVDNQLGVNYYDAWYFVAQASMRSAVPILEAQVAFLRNMAVSLILIAVFSVICFFCFGSYCKYSFIFFLCLFSCALILCLVKNRQSKIYERVFEDYKYLKRLEMHKENEEGI